MIELAAALETTELAQFLKRSRWVYPLVNAGHILGIALLVGAVVPMDLRLLGLRRGPDEAETLALLRPIAATGLVLAAACGIMLFVTQATDYVASGWFLAKIAAVAVALLNALWHLRGGGAVAATLSLVLWPTALILGRLVGYS